MPGGRPKGTPNDRKRLQKRELLLPLRDRSVSALSADLDDPDQRGATARYIIDQLYGKAASTLEDEDGENILKVIVETIKRNADSGS